MIGVAHRAVGHFHAEQPSGIGYPTDMPIGIQHFHAIVVATEQAIVARDGISKPLAVACHGAVVMSPEEGVAVCSIVVGDCHRFGRVFQFAQAVPTHAVGVSGIRWGGFEKQGEVDGVVPRHIASTRIGLSRKTPTMLDGAGALTDLTVAQVGLDDFKERGRTQPLADIVTHQRSGQPFVVILGILRKGDAPLAQVARASDLPRFFAGAGKDGEQNRRQNGDDGDDNQQLNQREGTLTFPHIKTSFDLKVFSDGRS
jgi:hypothetical protein